MTLELAESELLWRLTVEHSPVGTTLVAPDGRLLTANQALCDMLGYTEEQIRELTFQQITHPDDLAQDVTLVEETLAGVRSSFRLRKRYLHADGHVVHGDLSTALLRGPDGSPIHFISQILDVSEAHEYAERVAETTRELEGQRRHLEAILDSVDVGVAVIDKQRGLMLANRRNQQFLDLMHPQGMNGPLGRSGDVFDEDGRRLSVEELPSTRAADGEEFDEVIVWVGADPVTQRALSVSARSVRGLEGELSGAVLASSDVTELVRALAAKEQFVAAVSHELRTPLTSVLGHLELAQDHVAGSPELAERLQVVERNALRLRELVGDLLQVAQMTDGRLRLTRSPVDLATVVRAALDESRPLADEAGLTLTADLPELPLVARVDGPRVQQIVDNLVGNAIKYTEPGGSVAVRLRRRGVHAELTVTDTGLGIAPDELERLWQRFFRGAEVARRQIPGAGLGLSIVRTIVESHGGRVRVDSTPGEGSTFRVELPLALSEPMGMPADALR